MISEEAFVQFVGKLVFEPENCGWKQFSPEQQESFCENAAEAELQTLFLLLIGEDLPKKYQDEFSRVYHREAMTRLIEKAQLMAFNRLWDERNIPFVPFKGADLAFRIYPDPALRPHDDWDIFFRSEDCPQVIQTLVEQGWRTYSGNPPDKIERLMHHYERMHNDKNSIEVHWTLQNCGSMTPEDIWAETMVDAQGRRHLTPEMNLLIICAHASSCNFCHVSKWRLLLDVGYILRHDAVDWRKVQTLAENWGIMSPVILLDFWRDFFPKGMLPLDGVDSRKQEELKIIFRLRGQVNQANHYVMGSSMSGGGLWPWLKDKLGFYFRPASIRCKYNLKRHQVFRLVLCALWDFAGKVWYFSTHWHSRQCRDIRRYNKALDCVQK